MKKNNNTLNNKLEHISNVEIEAWGELINTLYDFYIKKSKENVA